MRIWRIVVLLLIVVAAACGGSGGPAIQSRDIDLAAFERELAALPLPDGVEPALWASLKDELRSAVNKAASERAVSAAPDSPYSTVDDFAVKAETDGTATCSWTYRNQGDYNQDKLVSVHDLTPIGLYFNAREGDSDWDAAQLADGDRNGLVTVSDITPIGQYYQRRVEGYRLQAGAVPGVADNWQLLKSVIFDYGYVPSGGYRRRFSYPVKAPDHETYYRVVPSDGADLGNPSNYAQYSSIRPMVTVHVPEVLVGGEQATWTAEWEHGTGPYTITWDFGGGAEDVGPMAAESPDEQTVIMINESRTNYELYTYTVTVEDSLGVTGTAQDLYPVAANPHPLVTVTVPEEMRGHQEATWSVEWYGGYPPYFVTWEFGGGAMDPITANEVESPLEHVATMLNDSETEDAEYSYTVTVADAHFVEGVAQGDYIVGPLGPLEVTVTVPDDMQGGTSAVWNASWNVGQPPFEVSWQFGGGADDYLESTDDLSEDHNPQMLNDSRFDSAQYSYTVVVTDDLGLVGESSGDYTVGPDPRPLVTVTVPDNMNGGEDAEWSAEWIAGVPPYEIYWDFGGGADDIGWEEATSPDTRTVTMFNPSLTSDTEYDYQVNVADSENNVGRAEGTFSVGPGPNLAPEIRSAWFEYATHTLFVNARDVNTEDTLRISVTEPAGMHVDATPKDYPTRQVLAEFYWTADEPADGRYGSTHVTLEDALGLSDETDVFLGFLEPDTLYAIPLQETALVDEPVTIVVTTGVMPNPFQYLCMVGLTVEPGASYVTNSLKPGAPGSGSGELSGIWGLMGATSVTPFNTGVDNGDGLYRWEFSYFPMGGHDLINEGGDLFNFQFTFDAAGTYTLGFVESTSGINRTYYGDWDEYEYYWGDITNDHEGFARSIVVME